MLMICPPRDGYELLFLLGASLALLDLYDDQTHSAEDV